MLIQLLGNHLVDYSSEAHHAKSLESLGHQVIRVQEGRATADEILTAAEDIDLLVWVKTHGWDTPGINQVLDTLRDRRIPVISYHLDLYMPIQRWQRYRDDPYMMGLDHFFTVDPKMSDWLNTNTAVRGHFLPAGVYDRECYISQEPSPHANDVIFVGAKGYHPEHPWRTKLIDWLRDTYGPRFTHVGGDGDTGTLRGDDLNRVYANSKVAVGDTLCVGFDYPGYASDRLFECPGRGGFNLFPHIQGLDDWYTGGEHIAYFPFGDFGKLKWLIDYYLNNPEERERIRIAGHEHTKANHTYRHRWETILQTVFG